MYDMVQYGTSNVERLSFTIIIMKAREYNRSKNSTIRACQDSSDGQAGAALLVMVCTIASS